MFHNLLLPFVFNLTLIDIKLKTGWLDGTVPQAIVGPCKLKLDRVNNYV